ncbi:MAG: hypothetical protein CL928_16285 [Deltaproteobacteria bacterium]|nr:hypothetical protein [Deltaproteobacteria bacterium]
MLEPWGPPDDLALPYRAVTVRQGFDLEPMLPDPAPAFVDPEGTLHPALTEAAASLTLHTFPTPGARSALVARMLSEPGRPDTKDRDDPFVSIYRFAARRDMEPEVTASLALLLLRGVMGDVERDHRPRLPDPSEAYTNPDHDPWRNRRARLSSVDWDGLWAEIQAGASLATTRPELEFERVLVDGACRWLGAYRAWWRVAQLLDSQERIPTDKERQEKLSAGLEAVRRACSEAIGGPAEPANPADILARTMAFGVAAEQEFMQATAAQPDGTVNAKWLLGQQLRSLRHIDLATREHSLHLHKLLRKSDIARVATQLAYRAALIDLWLHDINGQDPEPLEQALLEVEPPPHTSTLGAGLGRVIGMILLRRLRRGNEVDALELAEQAKALAPGELAVRMTWNDLHYIRGALRPSNGSRWSVELLRSLREEQDRWSSLTVASMGARVSDGLGDASRGRWFREHLVERAIQTEGGAAWGLAVVETLGSSGGRTDAPLLNHLLEWGEEVEPEAGALSWVLFGTNDLEELQAAHSDLQSALTASLQDLEEAATLVPTRITPAGRVRQPLAWRQLVQRPWPAANEPQFPSAIWTRIQALRAASPELRVHPIAGALRELQEHLSRGADLVASDGEAHDDLVAAWSELTELPEHLGAYLAAPDAEAAEAQALWIEQAFAPLRVAVRKPRAQQLRVEIDQLAALCRIHSEPKLLEYPNRLRAELARALTAEQPDAALDALDGAIHKLVSDLLARDPHATPDSAEEEQVSRGLMRFHPEFESFSTEELSTRTDALRRAREMVRLFNLSGGQRDRKKLKGKGPMELFELRHRTAHTGGLRVFYRPDRGNWLALAAMSKYDDRHQRDAIERIRRHFAEQH